MRIKLLWLIWITTAALCSGCGGGGGGSAPPIGNPPAPGGDSGGDGDNTPTIGRSARFSDRTNALGLDYNLVLEPTTDGKDDADVSGGITLLDIENDGSFELYVAHGRNARGRLYRYDGSSFVPVENNAGINPTGIDRAGYFIDLDSDDFRDFISIQDESVEVFLNDRNGAFIEATSVTGLHHERTTYSMAAADVDLDGDVDLFFSHWNGILVVGDPLTEYLWENDGTGFFTDVSDRVPIKDDPFENDPDSFPEFSYTPTFADIDDDGFPDMLLAADNGYSQVLRNDGGMRFIDATTPVISDRNGMGGTAADYDRDGDLDWFVSSIHNLTGSGEGTDTGNRLYRNTDGLGNFEDVTDEAGVRNGDWGWGSCFADFDNDGFVDIFHTNGMPDTNERYDTDQSRLFMSNGDGTFTDRAFSAGISHNGQGRGIVCADYNDDGRLDIMIANNGQSPTVYENTSDNANHYLAIDLIGRSGNADAIGARVTVESASGTQTQEVQLGTWYLSQGPATLHFGLGSDDVVTHLRARWPDASEVLTELADIAVDRRIVLIHP